jgi:glucosamine--fructose-6-phosphate aminotransferase (isomerizing)
MRREIEEIPHAVQTLLDRGGAMFAQAGVALREKDPSFVATVARGSSDHAASFLKYACEMTLGIPFASIGPSIASIYGAKIRVRDAACLAVSQSGKSPDIVRMVEAARDGGALTFALTNTLDSPLAAACRHVIDIMAGPEQSVAATKTFVNSAVAGLAVLAEAADDAALRAALRGLPGQLQAALGSNWNELCVALDGRRSLFIVGRGPAYAIAMEAALKFKETCAVHAEAYSAAELMHGPVSIVCEHFPVLALVARDAAQASTIETMDGLAARGADVFATSAEARQAKRLSFAPTGHVLTEPLSLVVSFYSFIEMLARRRGLDPDRPANLKKVTETE